MTTLSQKHKDALLAIRDGVVIETAEAEELERLGLIVVTESGANEITEMGAAEIAKSEQ